MSLEAMDRNGHNMSLPYGSLAPPFGIPVLQPAQLNERLQWIPFNAAMTDKCRAEHGVHFFIDDYLFERAWHDPYRYATLLSGFRAVMTPDFSLFTDYPVAVQIYNHYRKHLLGAYWQWLGLTVIPSICWSDEASFEWCFDGEPVGGTVAVSSVGTQKNPVTQRLFLAGYHEMMRRLSPVKIIFFGDVPEECEGPIEHHPPYYAAVHARKRR